MVVLVAPLLREHLHLPESVKDLPVQELNPQLAIECSLCTHSPMGFPA